MEDVEVPSVVVGIAYDRDGKDRERGPTQNGPLIFQSDPLCHFKSSARSSIQISLYIQAGGEFGS